MKEQLKERIKNLSRPQLELLALQLYKEQLYKEQLYSQQQNSKGAGPNAVAIVGVGCRLPGGVVDLPSFWKLLSSDTDPIHEVDYGNGFRGNAGVLGHYDKFDAEFFGLTPGEAKVLDPHQRLLMECGWEALEIAGITDAQQLQKLGVFMGVAGGEWFAYQSNPQSATKAHKATGMSHSSAAGRLAYFLGGKGPALSIDTACSSSLMAVHLACDSILRGESDIALAGGVNLILGADVTQACAAAGMLSPSGRCKTFDDSADGYVRSEGCVVFTLMPLHKAEQEQRQILGVIRGTAANHNGRSAGLTVPSSIAQTELISAAVSSAGINFSDVDYVEAHGTGTALGDPIEINALQNTYGRDRTDRDPVWVSSVKACIGHTETAAGGAGLLHVLAMLRYHHMPANRHLKTPNKRVRWAELGLQPITAMQAWPSTKKPRIAAVSSFGFSGSNAHIVVEEHPNTFNLEANNVDRPIHLLKLSAKNADALAALKQKYAQRLTKQPNDELADIAFSANVGRADFNQRAVVIGASHDAMSAALHNDGSDNSKNAAGGILVEGKTLRKKSRIGFIFSGQGAQYAGMGKALYESDPLFKEHIEHCSALLTTEFGFSLEALLWGEQQELLSQTRYTQPALYVLQTGIVNYLRRCSVTPEAVLGHSVGEFAAAYCAGVLSLDEGLSLIQARGALMWEHCPQGKMLAVFDQPSAVTSFVEQHADRISLAAYNSPRSTVVAGDGDTLDALAEHLAAKQIKTVSLNVSHGFHSVQMTPMLEPFAERVNQVSLHAPRVGFYSTVTATRETTALTSADYWVNHVQQPVNFQGGIQALANSGIDVFLEIGPGATLTTLGQMCCDVENGLWLNSQMPQQEWPTLLNSVAQLYVRGAEINWKGVDQPYQRKRVSLPTYPFQRKRFWLDEEMTHLIQPPGFEEKPMVKSVYKIQWEKQALTGNSSLADRRILFIDDGSQGWDTLLTGLQSAGAEVINLAIAELAGDATSSPTWSVTDREALKTLIQTQGPFTHTIIAGPVVGNIVNDLVNNTAADTAAFANQLNDNALVNYERASTATLAMANVLGAYFESEGQLAIGRVYCVTQAAQAVIAKETVAVAGAVIWGAGKTASLEYAHLWGGLVDFSTSVTAADVGLFVTELSFANGEEDQIAIRQGARWVPRLVNMATPAIHSITVKPNASYLITGGLGGIGLSSAQYLVNQGATCVYLMSRRGEAALATDNNADAKKIVEQLREQGADIIILAADISDDTSLTQVFEKISSAGKPLAGVIHAAGIEKSAGLHELTGDDLRESIQSKTIGAWLLHQHTAALTTVDFFICCASISGVWGSGLLAAYAAGNHALDALCAYRESLGLPATSISWGPWGEVGMAAGAQGKYLADAGLRALKSSAATNTLFALTASGSAQQVVVDADWHRFIAIMEVRRPRPLFNTIKQSLGLETAQQTAATANELAKELAGLSSQERHTLIRDRVRADIARIFGFDAPTDLAIDSPLHEIGADSIQAVAVKHSLEAMIGAKLPTTLVFDYPTIDDIAGFINESLSGGAPAVQPAVVSAGPDWLHEPIAIVGMGCRFPGKSESLDAYWQLLVEGRDGIIDSPESRFDIENFLGEATAEQAKAYTLSTGMVEGIEEFDAAFFAISPREAKALEPQQRMALETTWTAIENAGYAPSDLHKSNTGVYFGSASNDYLTLCQGDKTLADAITHFATGNNLNVISGRLSYALGLMGPSMTLDTACSSSLVALHTACQALRTGDCDMAIAGGTNAICTPLGHVMLCQSQMLSPSGRCHTFDAAADGYVRGEGAGVVILKRLSDAQRDGDNILAVIRASAVNQDGRSSSLTAPNGPAQQAVIRKALAQANLTAADIDFVEAHGTGTALGDPIELNALDATYASAPNRQRPLILGAVKSNIGHLESASGIAGLIKVVLSLRHEAIPANLHFHSWNPNIDVPQDHFAIPTALTPWPRGDRPRRGAVSSFGFSGTNAHVIIEDAPVVAAAEETVSETPERPAHILTLSAKAPGALESLVTRYSERMGSATEAPADIAYAANAGRSHFGYRMALVGNSVDDWAMALKNCTPGATPDNGYRGDVTATPRIGFIFSGQGAQYAGMGKALYESDSLFKEHIEHCSAQLTSEFGFSLEALLWGEQQELLSQTRYTQPALYVLQTGIVNYLRRCGVTPEAVLGHSVGEFAAAYCAGVLSLDEGLSLIQARGALMWEHCPQGKMLAVFDQPSAVTSFVEQHADRISLAAYNSPRSTVVAGDGDTLDALAEHLAAKQIKTVSLNVSHGFHSVQMTPMLEPFAERVNQVSLNAPRVGFYSTVTATRETTSLTSADYWVNHVQQPVNFQGGIQALANSGIDVFLEIGPGATLTTLGQMCCDVENGLWLNSQMPQQEWPTLLNSVAQLYVRGAEINWKGVDQPYQRKRVSLPTYPFQRKRFWPQVAMKTFNSLDDLSAIEALSDEEIDKLLADTTTDNSNTTN